MSITVMQSFAQDVAVLNVKTDTISLEPVIAMNVQHIVPSVQIPTLAQNVSMGGTEQNVKIPAEVHVGTVWGLRNVLSVSLDDMALTVRIIVH